MAFGQGPFGSKLNVEAQVTNGTCPHCAELSIFVSINPEIFRCTTCGADCRQYINGKISYLPILSTNSPIAKDGPQS
jgi:uncharacterized protein (DUF983 family)